MRDLADYQNKKIPTPAEYQPASPQDQALVHPPEVLQFTLRYEPLLDKNKVQT
jgi:hypothetical protein